MQKKNFQKKRKYLRLVVILLLLISIGYAALTTTLTINGTANISATSWSVYFSNVVLDENNNVALVTTAPNVPEGSTTTTTLSWNVSMDTPDSDYSVVQAYYRGTLVGRDFDEVDFAFRPVVCLPSSVVNQ